MQQEAPAPEQVERALLRWDRFRMVLLAGWLLVLVATVAVGQRETRLADLETAVAEGRVDTVVVLGEAPADPGVVSTQVVHWTDGLVRRTTEAAVAAPPVASTGATSAGTEDLGVLLSRLDPDLQVRRAGLPSGWARGELLGWRVPTWLVLTAVATFLLQVGHLGAVPQTWRATRWAWFWVMTVPIVGPVLALLLSGRTPGLPAPGAGGRRLTGGWAFLLSAAAGSLLSGAPGT